MSRPKYKRTVLVYDIVSDLSDAELEAEIMHAVERIPEVLQFEDARVTEHDRTAA